MFEGSVERYAGVPKGLLRFQVLNRIVVTNMSGAEIVKTIERESGYG